MISRRTFGLGLFTALSAGAANAALPPGAYEELMRGAAELLDLEIIRVQKRVSSKTRETDQIVTRYEVSVQARVLRVYRSKDNLPPRRVIDIVYYFEEYSRRPIPGAGYPRELKAGEKIKAYLNPRDDSYGPAAYGASFQAIDSAPR